MRVKIVRGNDEVRDVLVHASAVHVQSVNSRINVEGGESNKNQGCDAQLYVFVISHIRNI
jgi:hypothetical protein